MSALEVGRRVGWLRPGIRPQINWQHPLAQGLVFCMVDGYDLLSNFRLTLSSTASTPYGTGVRGTGENADTTSLDFANTESFSVMSAGFWSANTSSTYPFSRFSYTSESVNSGWALVRASSTLRFETFNNSAASVYRQTSPASMTTGPFVAIGTVLNSVRKSLYVNTGASITQSSVNYKASTSAGNVTVMQTTDGSAAINAAWRGRELNQAEAAMLIADPFCFLTSPTNLARVAYAAAAAPPAPSTSEWDLSLGGGIGPGGLVFPSRHLHLVS